MTFRSTNPIFKKMGNYGADFAGSVDYELATYKGVVKKSVFYLLMTIIGAIIGIGVLLTNSAISTTMLIIAIISSFITGLVALVSPKASKTFGTIYCISEGMLLGIISLIFEALIGGTVFTAFISTIVVFAVITTLYMTNIVKVNGRFMRFLFAFSIGVIISQLVIFLVSLLGLFNYADNFLIFIGVSVIMVFLACLYLLFDLDKIRVLVEGNAPKEMEWYASFGLIFTLLWLYVEMLRIVFLILSLVRRN